MDPASKPSSSRGASESGCGRSRSRIPKPLLSIGEQSLLEIQITNLARCGFGDILTTIDFRRFYGHGSAQDSDFTVGTKNIITPFSFGKVHIEGNRIVRVEEKPEVYTEIVAGIYIHVPRHPRAHSRRHLLRHRQSHREDAVGRAAHHQVRHL